MVKTTHIRQGNVITDLATGKKECFMTPKGHPSINKAKKDSRIIQLGNGGLGGGAVQVIS